jgi:hypothetical protein
MSIKTDGHKKEKPAKSEHAKQRLGGYVKNAIIIFLKCLL